MNDLQRRPATEAARSATSIEAMLASQLSEQLRGSSQPPSGLGEDDGSQPPSQSSVVTVTTPSKSKSLSKARSLSDSAPRLSPSPNITEGKRSTQDDHTTQSFPKTPRRPDFVTRGFSLHMPTTFTSSTAGLLPIHGPLSPKLDSRDIYGSPASVLPRHSRGLDFSRACTNLHHSTLAEASSPDSSPTVTQEAILIPQRSALSSNTMTLDSPHTTSAWSHGGAHDRTAQSGSVSSINMLDSSDSDSDGPDPMDPDDADDVMISTPQATRAIDASAATPFPTATVTARRPWPGVNPNGPSSFMSFQRARLRHRNSRHSSSSASGHSALASPLPQSPPNGRADGMTTYFARQLSIKKAASRRESLSIGTKDLHISSGNDSGDEAGRSGISTPAVVQRAVTRRGNLLPKTRAFGRIRADLIEESCPVDSEVRREAEVIRQVRESDASPLNLHHVGESSPVLAPASEGLDGIPEDNNNMDTSGDGSSVKGLFGTFSRQAMRNSISGGKEFWKNFDTDTFRTPPPPAFHPCASSAAMSDDIVMDSPTTSSSTPSTSVFATAGPMDAHRDSSSAMSRSSTPQPQPPSAADGIRKRRRDDDLDGMSMKRRAVSPGMLSVQNSPVLSQSPGQREANIWGRLDTQGPGGTVKFSRETPVVGMVETGQLGQPRSNSGGTFGSILPAIGPGGKRVGLRKMVDTNEGLEKMSIE